ncbi:MAG: hypothetical protein CVV39_05280 [Planctomycetes bacterium HGW-Planctomycetes-1]|nr:MAG: hypothetical protein CVV39_05280 [Planctomycetes bacterium HGW-Planctomycetes-1]
MQLRVIKADGTQEEYFHTKVIATFVNAFAAPDESNTAIAQQLSEAVTFYLYNKNGSSKTSSSEILSIIKAVLISTGFGYAAEILTEHQQRRNLARMRVKVVKTDMKNLSASTPLLLIDRLGPDEHWNKSKIIYDLINEHNLDPAAARTVAALVEEKILDSGFRLVPTGFIKFLALWQMQVIISAAGQLKTSTKTDSEPVYHTDMDIRLRQPQNGLCPIEA